MIHLSMPRILCPVDFSPSSEAAFHHAVALARWFGSRITLLHVQEAPWSSVFGAVAEDGRFQAAQVAEAQQAMETWLSKRAPAGIEVDGLVRQGRPVDDIVAASHEFESDIIVMGTHGRGGFERLMLGSVTERVMRKVACPVMTIPPGVDMPEDGVVKFGRVLCAYDASPAARRAATFAVGLARESGGTVTLLTTVEALPQPIHFDRFDLKAFHEERLRVAQESLAEALPAAARAACTVNDRVTTGHPAAVVLRQATELKADLIVLGARGLGPFAAAVIGSTTQHVVRHANCPVLTIGAKD